MRKGSLFILILAIAMGGVAAYMARVWIIAQQMPVTAATHSTVVVAANSLAFGTPLSRENVTEISWPEGAVPEGAYATKDQLFKDGRRVALTPMQRNELILKSRITGPGQKATLSALLDEGKRAVTLRVDDVRGVAGFVLPGDRVDVVLIRSAGGANGPEQFSDVLLQHVKVLAVDQLVNERQENPTIAKAVTLEVDTDQAQKILLATNVGKLSLILRQAGESNPVAAQRVTERDLGRQEPVPTPTVAPAPVLNNSITVSIIRNMKREEYSVMRSK
jgi:pilus assembly protein CpaB